MIELLYTTLVIFGFFIPVFLMLPNFSIMKLIFVFFQFILFIILLSNNFYKKLSLYKGEQFKFIQNTGFLPINSLYKSSSYDDLGNPTINFGTMSSSEFSLIKTEKFSIQCLENYWIQSDESCPITDIYLGNKNDNKYQNYIKITENEYIYYSKENKIGKLYESFNYTEFKENKENSHSIDTLVRKEFNKLSNPIYDFKFYIKFCDTFCFILIIISLWSVIQEIILEKSKSPKATNILVQLIVIILQFIRFIKFIEVKKFLSDNEDIYNIDDEKYFPNEVFNIDSFPLSVSINILIFNLLFVRCKNKPSCCDKRENNKEYCDSEILLIFQIIPIYITYFAFVVLDFVNDRKIGNIYNNLIYNWNMNPISSISLYDNYWQLNHNFAWESDYFFIEKLNNFDYINIYTNTNGKICGKDNFGNNLYFPDDVDCPINKIFVSYSNTYLPGYQKLRLNNGKFLYYTNEYIEGKIVTDLRISNLREIPLNPDYSDVKTNIPFYEEIDYNLDNSYLFAINYLGLNTSSVSTDKLKKLKYNIKVYIALSKGKIALFCLQHAFIIIAIIIFCCENHKSNPKKCLFIIPIIINIINFLLQIIFVIICLNHHVKYITNFINKINLDFEKDKNDFKWNLIILLYLVVSIPYLLIMSFIIDDDRKSSNEESTNEININNNDKRTEDIIRTKDQKIEELTTQIQKMKDTQEILTINNKEKELSKKIEDLKNIITSKDEEINKLSRNPQTSLELLGQKEKEINKLKSSIPFDISEGEKVISVLFLGDSIQEPIICTQKQIFNEVENKLYEKFPELKNGEYYFLVGGNKVNKYLTLEENNIKDGAKILIYELELGI